MLIHLAGSRPGPSRGCSTRWSRRSTSAPAWWSGSGTRSATSRWRTPTPPPANSADYDAYHLNSIQLLPGNRVLDLGPGHLGCVSDRSNHRPDPVDPGRQGEQLPPASRRPVLLPARRADDRSRTRSACSTTRPARRSRRRPRARWSSSSTWGTARAAVKSSHRRPGNNTLAQSEGSAQRLPGGNVFVGLRLDAVLLRVLGHAASSCSTPGCPPTTAATGCSAIPGRATPTTRPDVVVRRTSPTRVSVYVELERRHAPSRAGRSSRGPSTTKLGPVAHRRRTAGFETRIDLNSAANTFAVRALSAAAVSSQPQSAVTAS